MESEIYKGYAIWGHAIVQDDGYAANDILITPRIGITKEASRPARYLIAGNPYVSKQARAAKL